MSGRKRKTETDHVQPDLPIVPMLDMSFQLLAFLIMSFRPNEIPAPPGMFTLPLPVKQEQGGGASLELSTKAKQVVMKVYVDKYADATQQIRFSVQDPNLTGVALSGIDKALIEPIKIQNGSAEEAMSAALGELQKRLPAIREYFEKQYGPTVDDKDKGGDAKKPIVKLQFEIDGTVAADVFVKLLDVAADTGYTDYSHNLQENKDKEKEKE